MHSHKALGYVHFIFTSKVIQNHFSQRHNQFSCQRLQKINQKLNVHHYQHQACRILYDINSYMFTYLTNSIKHQTNTCLYQDNMIYNQIQMNTQN